MNLTQADAAIAEHDAGHPGCGDLHAVLEGTVGALSRTDWWLPGRRERAAGVLRGAPVERLLNPAHGARPYRIAPCDTSPADRALHAVGLALSSDGHAVVHLGIGSAAQGAFHAALNLARLNDAPVVFVVTAHELTDEAPLATQLGADLSALATAYQIHHFKGDGQSIDDVRSLVNEALDLPGPSLIELTLERTS